jgi:hypothetical protein
MNPENLDISQAYDSALLAASFAKTLEYLDLDHDEQIENIALLIDKLDKHIQSSPDCEEVRFWKIGLIGLRILRIVSTYQSMAITGSGNILEERERLSVLWARLKKEVLKLSSKDNRMGVEKLPSEINIGENVEELILFLKALPLPTIYFKKNKDGRKQIQERKEVQNEDAPPLIRLIAYIDNTPLLTPQLLHPQLLYSLKFVVRGVSWPDNATKLHLDLPTTLPRNDYSVSKFELPLPDNNANEFEGELTGHIRFAASQTLLSENISFVVRCAFELQNGQFDVIPVIGYSQLEFHIVDPKNNGFISGYPRLDQHVMQLLNQLLTDNPSIKDELEDLVPLYKN